MEKQKWQTNTMCKTEKSTVWDTRSSHTILEAIVEWGFELNEHDDCVVNKIIKRKQCTITWHMDDLKISHADKMLWKTL